MNSFRIKSSTGTKEEICLCAANYFRSVLAVDWQKEEGLIEAKVFSFDRLVEILQERLIPKHVRLGSWHRFSTRILSLRL